MIFIKSKKLVPKVSMSDHNRLYFNTILCDIDKFQDLIPNKRGLGILKKMMREAANNEIASSEDAEYVRRIANHIFPYSYDCRVPYDKLCDALDVADKNGWHLRFALDVEFYNKEASEEYLMEHPDLPWYEKRKVGTCASQCDGWSYHIEFEK